MKPEIRIATVAGMIAGSIWMASATFYYWPNLLDQWYGIPSCATYLMLIGCAVAYTLIKK